MIVRAHMRPIVILAALAVMIAALVFAALNHSHAVVPARPMHQAR